MDFLKSRYEYRKYFIILTLVFLAMQAVAQISPGELSKPHESLQGIKNCTKCHEFFLPNVDVLILTVEADKNLALSARNMRAVDVNTVSGVDPVSLVRHEKVILTKDAAKRFEEMLG